MTNNSTKSKYPPDAKWAMKRIIDFIEGYAIKFNLDKNKINILDWGCGFGNDTAWLREQGYNAFGVDIDESCIEKGKILLKTLGHDQSIIRKVCDNKTDFTDDFFHVIYSKQVLEHVSNLHSAAKEFKRILSDEGAAFHIFPAHHHIVERHLHMPFIHWLPKNKIRKALISAYVQLGIEPNWKGTENMSNAQKAERYYYYSINKTYYRSSREVKEILENAGLCVQFNVLDHPKLKEYKMIRSLLNYEIFRKLINILLLTFINIELVAISSSSKRWNMSRSEQK